MIAAGRPGNLPADATEHEDVADARSRGDGLVGSLLHRHHLAPPVEAVGANEDGRLGVVQPARNRGGAVAAEERQHDGTEAGAGARCAGHLGPLPRTQSLAASSPTQSQASAAMAASGVIAMNSATRSPLSTPSPRSASVK